MQTSDAQDGGRQGRRKKVQAESQGGYGCVCERGWTRVQGMLG